MEELYKLDVPNLGFIVATADTLNLIAVACTEARTTCENEGMINVAQSYTESIDFIVHFLNSMSYYSW